MIKHGDAPRIGNAPEYNSWQNAVSRCYNKHSPHYALYGAKGIVMTDRWLGFDGYQHFLEDMGRRPSPDLCLRRYDSTGDYEPGNCCWAAKSVKIHPRWRGFVPRVYIGASPRA